MKDVMKGLDKLADHLRGNVELLAAVEVFQTLVPEVEVLKAEKASLEKACADERARLERASAELVKVEESVKDAEKRLAAAGKAFDAIKVRFA